MSHAMVKVAQKETDLQTALTMCVREKIPKSPWRRDQLPRQEKYQLSSQYEGGHTVSRHPFVITIEEMFGTK